MKFYKPILFSIFLILFIQPMQFAHAAENHDELFVLIGDSLMKAKAGDQTTVAKNIEQFAEEWATIRDSKNKQAQKVNQALKKIQRLLANQNTEKGEIGKSLSILSSAVVQYDQAQNPADRGIEKEKVKGVLPYITTLNEAIASKNEAQIKASYQTLLNQWTTVEKIVHDESIASYGNIEKYMALIRISTTQEPADYKKAETNIGQLKIEVDNVIAGKFSNEPKVEHTLADFTAMLNKAEKQIKEGNLQAASVILNESITIWPMVEGDVSTRDAKLYSDIETKIPTAISILNSNNADSKKAEKMVKNLYSRVAPLVNKTDYSITDAALILLREGLEGLLIVATLIAFLKKMGQSHQQKWIWSGVAAGLLASGILAVIINIIFSKITAASSREYIEGITGIVAVIMMLTVGAWLHNKSSIGNWNRFIKEQMNQAIAKGSLISFAVVSFLSVFREGAETIIFYTGITPYISLQQLVMGIVIALVILVVVGFAIIFYSVKIPIQLFFKVATLLIYFLAFKILGISIHALQISNVLPMTTMERLPFNAAFGFYPTLETASAQVLLILVIIVADWVSKKKSSVTTTTTT